MAAASTRWAHTDLPHRRLLASIARLLCSRRRTPTHTVRNPGSAGGFLRELAWAEVWHCMTAGGLCFWFKGYKTAGGQLSTSKYIDQSDGAHLRLHSTLWLRGVRKANKVPEVATA